MEFTLVELAILIFIAVCGLAGLGKLLQHLSSIHRTLREMKLLLEHDRKQV